MLLEVRDAKVAYRRGRKVFEAVRGVSFSLDKGRTLGIVGESGSGKSTLSKALALLLPFSGGSALYEGRDISAFTRAERARYRRSVQMVFQDATGSMNPRMKVRAALEEVLSVHRPELGRKERASRIAELLDSTGLASSVLEQYPRELSGGQCQRASFARALAAEPSVLIADEPVSALDVSVQARILNLVRDLRERLGISVILVSHDLAVVRNVCDGVCVMHAGLFEESGPAEEVFAHPRTEYTRNLLAAVPDVARALRARREEAAAREARS